MFVEKSLCVLLVLIMAARVAKSADDVDIFDKGYRMAFRIYDECQKQGFGVSPCLKKKAITFFDRVARFNNIPITENLELIKNDNDDSPTYSDQELESLGRAGSAREETLNNVLFDKITSLLNGFDMHITLPKMNSNDLKRSIEEGRGKMKKMMGMMMMGMAMKMTAMVPIAMGLLFLLAGKALIISKIALILALLCALKKIMGGSKHGGGEMMHGGWQSSGGGHGGWDRSMRSVAMDSVPVAPEGSRVAGDSYAHTLAYQGQNRVPQ